MGHLQRHGTLGVLLLRLIDRPHPALAQDADDRVVPQACWKRRLTQLLTNLPDTPVSQLDRWLPDEWKRRDTPPAT